MFSIIEQADGVGVVVIAVDDDDVYSTSQTLALWLYILYATFQSSWVNTATPTANALIYPTFPTSSYSLILSPNLHWSLPFQPPPSRSFIVAVVAKLHYTARDLGVTEARSSVALASSPITSTKTRKQPNCTCRK